MTIHDRIEAIRAELDAMVQTNVVFGAVRDHCIEQIASLQCQLEKSDQLVTDLRTAKQKVVDAKKSAHNDADYWADKYYNCLGHLREKETQYTDLNAENAKLKRIICEAHKAFHAD